MQRCTSALASSHTVSCILLCILRLRASGSVRMRAGGGAGEHRTGVGTSHTDQLSFCCFSLRSPSSHTTRRKTARENGSERAAEAQDAGTVRGVPRRGPSARCLCRRVSLVPLSQHSSSLARPRVQTGCHRRPPASAWRHTHLPSAPVWLASAGGRMLAVRV